MDATLARLIRQLTRLRRIQPQIGRLHALVLRLARGRIRRSVVLAGGQPVLALTTVGRRSGKRRSTAVAYVRDGNRYASAALNLGSDRDPAWALNVRVQPRAWIEVEGRRIPVRAREAEGEEAERLWRRFTERLPMTATSRRLAQREAPMFVWEPERAS